MTSSALSRCVDAGSECVAEVASGGRAGQQQRELRSEERSGGGDWCWHCRRCESASASTDCSHRRSTGVQEHPSRCLEVDEQEVVCARCFHRHTSESCPNLRNELLAQAPPKQISRRQALRKWKPLSQPRPPSCGCILRWSLSTMP